MRDFEIYSSADTLNDPEYLDILDESWESACAIFLARGSSQIARIWFEDILTPTLEEDEHAFYEGDIVDLGEDEHGKWIDIRLLKHTIKNHEYDYSRNDINKEFDPDRHLINNPEFMDKLLEGTAEFPDVEPEEWEALAEANRMNNELQVLLGNLKHLPIPDEYTRFYMPMIGPYMEVWTRF